MLPVKRRSSFGDVVGVLVLALVVVAILRYSGAIMVVTDPEARMTEPSALPRLLGALVAVTTGLRLHAMWRRSRARRLP